MSKFGSVAPKCYICTKSVYKAEELVAVGKTWHTTCFICGGSSEDGCKRVMKRDGYVDHNNEPFCNACYAKLFKPKGYNTATNSNTEAATAPARERSVSPTPLKETGKSLSNKNVLAAKISTAPKCYQCSKSVYKAEELVAIGKSWHISCFTCGGKNSDGCKRVLKRDGYLDHDNEPYCNSCYSKLFRPKGFNMASSINTDIPVETPSVTHVKAGFSDNFETLVAKRELSPVHKLGTNSPTCCVCLKSVNKFELVEAAGKSWHTKCFTCGGLANKGCKKALQRDHYLEQDGQPFCSACHVKLFGRATSPTPPPRVAPASVASTISIHSKPPAPPTVKPKAVEPKATNALAAKSKASDGPAVKPKATDVPAKAALVAPVNKVATKLGTAAPKCYVCSKSVYKAEEMIAINQTWHLTCFTCGGTNKDGCRKVLKRNGYVDHDSQPYCPACHSKLFRSTSPSPAGAGAAKASPPKPTLKFGTTAPKCYLCDKSVFKAEEQIAVGQTWHKTCFTCGGKNSDGCKRVLKLDGYLDHDKEPYCNACYSKLFRPKGFNLASGINTEEASK